MSDKPKAGFYWCASCGGCEESVVDLAEDILDVVAAIDFVFFPVAMDFKREDVEAMEDGEMTVCFINGALRTSEHREMARLLRRKSRFLIAYGSCSYQGGIPGLANLYPREEILRFVYHDSPSTENPEKNRPQPHFRAPEGDLELPSFDADVKALDQVVDVDYYIPGCAPPPSLLKAAVEALLSGELPPKGSVIAPDRAMCHTCPRIGTKPEKPMIKEFKRPWQIEIDPDKCLLAQGLVCLGAATRDGCGHLCINANMPCTGCMGPVSRVHDHGAAILTSLASLIDSNDPQEIEDALDDIPDPAGTFYRYGLPHSLLYAKCGITAGNGDA